MYKHKFIKCRHIHKTRQVQRTILHSQSHTVHLYIITHIIYNHKKYTSNTLHGCFNGAGVKSLRLQSVQSQSVIFRQSSGHHINTYIRGQQNLSLINTYIRGQHDLSLLNT